MCFLHLWFISCEYQNLSRLLTSLQWARAQLSFWRLTHWGRDKMAAVSQTMISNAFSWMKMYEFHLKFHWSLFLRFQLTIFQHWFRYWLGAVQATSHYLNQWWLVYWRIYASLSLSELGVKSCENMHLHNKKLSVKQIVLSLNNSCRLTSLYLCNSFSFSSSFLRSTLSLAFDLVMVSKLMLASEAVVLTLSSEHTDDCKEKCNIHYPCLGSLTVEETFT